MAGKALSRHLRLLARSFAGLLFASAIAAAANASAPALKINLPAGSPLLLQSVSLSSTPQHERGIPAAERFEALLQLRNTGNKTIVGISFSISYESFSSVPAASQIVTGLRVAPEGEFPLHVALETAHGARVTINSPANVHITLDCVLFSDLSTYGPDRLGQHRNLLVYELQARREREYVSQLLKEGRLPDVREELNFGLPPEPPAWILTINRPPQYVRAHSLSIQPLVEDSPVHVVGGTVQAVGGRFWSPVFEVRSDPGPSPIAIDIALILADERGREAVAAILPFSIKPATGETTALQSDISAQATALDSVPVLIRKCYAFISAIHFSDASVWVPSRSDLERASDGSLLTALSACPERERLASLFRRGGMQAVASDLKRPE